MAMTAGLGAVQIQKWSKWPSQHRLCVWRPSAKYAVFDHLYMSVLPLRYVLLLICYTACTELAEPTCIIGGCMTCQE